MTKRQTYVKRIISLEKGERFYPEDIPINELHRNIIGNRKTLVFNENAGESWQNWVPSWSLGQNARFSAVFVPLLVGNRVFGTISLRNVDHEHAFHTLMSPA